MIFFGDCCHISLNEPICGLLLFKLPVKFPSRALKASECAVLRGIHTLHSSL